MLALAALPAMAQFANPLRNTATITPPTNVTNVDTACTSNGGTFNATTGACSATDSNTLAAVSDLSVTKTVSNPTPTVGTNVTFTVTVANAGPSAAVGTNVNDQLPAGYTFVSATPSVGTYNAGTGVWAVGTLASGANATLTIVATVLPTGPYANTATATSSSTDPTPGNNTATSTPVPVASADLAVTKTASSATPTVGTNVTFTVTVSNNGPSAAAGVNVNDQLPAGYTFVSATPSVGTYNAGTGVWAVGGLASGANATLQIVATVRATGPYANTATATSTTNDPTPGNNTATNTPVPVASADLAVTKTASSAAPIIGSNVTFTVTVANNGPSAAAGVNVNDQLPAGYTFVSATPSVGTYNAGTGVWAVGALASGANATLQIVATVLPTGPYANTATATSTTNDPTPGNNTATNTPVPVASADLAVTKTASSGTPTVGSNITFTVTVSNNGPSAAAAVNVNDQLPAGYTFVSATPSVGTYNAGTGVWAVGGLASGANATLQIVATVRATGPYANTATATSTTNDPTPGNNTATNTPVPVASADLAVTKTASSAAPIIGSNVTFTVTVSNNGPSAAAGVNVNDQLPAGYTFVSATPSVGTYNAGTGVWAVGALASGANATLQIVATVLPAGPYANTATATSTTSDPTPGNNTATNTPVPVASADLAVTKTASSGTPTVGTNITFTVTVSNNGPSAAAGVNVNDQLPAGYTFVSATPSVGTYNAGTGVWAVGGLASGANATLQIVATVLPTGPYANTATATSTTSDPTPGNNTATNTPVPVASADLAVTKTASSAAPIIGSNVTFTVTVSNNGPSAAAGVNVNDQLPAGYTFVSATPSVGTYNAGTGVWAVGALASGANATLQIVATVLPTGPYANTATATSTTNDPTPGNNTATNTPVPVASADLAVTKTASSAAPIIGTNVTFTVTVSNNGPSAAAGVNVNDQLPAGYTFVSATPSVGTYNAGTGVWAVGGLASGANATLQIVATVRATGPYANTATATSTTNDPTPGNNTATNTPVPVASADLAVTKTASSAAPIIGSNVTFTVTVSNNGPSAAAGVNVNDQLPAGYTFVSATPSVGTYNAGTGVWAVGALASGANATLQIVATVLPTGPYANTATATSTTNDPTPGNNTATNTPVPVASADLAVTKTASSAAPIIGTNVTFTVTVSNNGPSAAAGVNVNDQLPAGYTFVSATPSVGTYNAGTGVWAVGGLASGANATLQIVATVRATGPYANTATATSTTNDPTPGNNTATNTPVPVASADLAVTKTASSAAPIVGTNVTFTVTVSNNGPSAAAGVNVNDQLPAGYTFVSATPSVGTYNAGTGVWAVGALASGANATLQIVATVLPTGPYANTATATSTTNDPTPGNNTATNTPVPVASADLAVTKTASSAAPIVGTNITFTVTVSNNGPSAAAGVNVNDQLPAGYTFVSATPSVGTYNAGTGVWAVGGLASGANATLQIVATVRATGPYANTATATSTTNDPTPGNNTATNTPVPVASADLAVTKTASSGTPTVGTNITFTVTVSNNGPSAAAGVNVNDQLPAGYTFVSANPSVGTYNAGTGVWAVGALASGANATLQIVATVLPTGPYANTATATSTTNDPTPGNNTATNTPVPVASADLAVTKTASSAAPIVGTNVTFTVTVSNNGPSAAAGVNVNDQLPAGYTFVSANPSVGTYNAGTGVWAVGALASGANATLQIVATVLPTGPYANTATATSTTNDPTPGNNTATNTPVPVASADLAVTKTASSAAPIVGTNVTFTVTVSNNGPSAAAGVNVNDQLPAGYTFVSANPSVGTYNAGTGVWAVGALASGANATLQIVATVLPTGPYANTATATSTTNDPTPGNNTATNTPVPVASADLAVTKTASSAAPIVGTNITFTVTVSNNGPSAAAGVNVNDQLPAGYTFVSATPSVGTYNAGTGVWAVGALASGANATLQIVATVLPTGPYANTATATSTTNDPTPGNNTATNTPVPVASADLAVTKTASNPTPTVGTNVTFTVTVSNNGPSAAAGVNVNDQLPSGYTLVSATPSAGTYNAGTGVWAVGALASGDSETLTVVATVLATGSYANTATATSTTSDPTPGNNTATSTPSPTASADLAVTKAASNAAPIVGTNVTFTVTVTNNGPSSAAAVNVNDQLPAGYTFVSSNPSVGTYNAGTGVWAIGALASGASETLDIVATVLATGPYANTATATSTTGDPNSANNSATNTPVPVASADLAVTKTASNAAPVVGTNVTFTVTVSNNGPSAAAGVNVNDQLPAGYTFVSATPSVGTYNAGTGVWAVGTLVSGASETLDIVATVLATGPYANTATATSTTGDPTPGNNTATNTPVPVASADLAVTKTASTATPTVGTDITFTVTVSNNGPSAAAGVNVNDQLPSGYTLVSATPSIGTYNAGTGVWAVGTVAAGDSETLTVVATVLATGSYANTATATSTTSDPTPGNNTATNTPTPVASADLAVTKTASNAAPIVGTNVTFTVTVINNGPSSAAAVNVTDQLPAGYTFVSANPSVGTYNAGTGVWAVGTLASGANETLDIVATVLATGPYANTATATSTTGDPTPGNNTATNTPVPVASADLAVTKTASTATPTVGTDITFTVTVSNNGPSAAAGVNVNDQLPSGYTLVSATPSIGTYNAGTGVWAVGTVAAGDSETLTVVATVLATGSYANTATATSTTSDPTPGNNTATNTPTPVASADLAVTKTASNAAPIVGTNVTFTVTVSNNGPSSAAAVNVTDQLPAGYTFVSSNPSVGTYNAGTGVWAVGTLVSGANETLDIVATVLATGPYANTATATSTTGDPTPGNNTATNTPVPVASADLAVTKTASTATPTVGTDITFTVTVSNNGPSAAAGVNVNDQLPSGYTLVSATPSIGTYNAGTGVWAVGTVAAGDSETLTVVATVLATGSYANTATATSTTSDPTPGNNTATNTPTPVASADLAVTKTASNAAPIVGTNVTFTVTVSNNGPSTAAAVNVTDQLPAGYTFVSANPSVGTYNAGTGVWAVGTLVSGANETLDIVATVLATGPYANTATATSTTGDPTPGNNTATNTPVPVASADLAVTKTASTATPTVGTDITFTVTVSNNGPSSADGVNVTDQLPSGYTLVSATPSAGTYTAGTGVWAVGTVAAGDSETLTVVATVLATGSYANTATATSTTSDPTPGNNTATNTPTPVASADLAVTKTASNPNPVVGTNVTFTVTVTNNGPSSAAAVNVNDQLPAGYTFVSSNPSVGTYNAGTGVWAVGTLASGANETLDIVATVLATGPYANTATATSTTGDPTPGNNTATSTPTPVASADLAVIKTASNPTPTVGTNVTFTVTVSNNGPSSADGVNVTDQLPSGYSLVSATPSVGTYNAGTGVWTVGTLASGDSETLSVVATVLATGSYANTATATSTTGDPTPGNNTSTSTPSPVASADLAVAKTASTATPTVGTDITFTVTVSNNGPSSADGVNVTDQLPSGYTLVSATPSIGTYNAGTGVWAVGTLTAGSNETLTVVATVLATGSYANTATATSTTSDPTPGNNTATNTPTPVASADLAVTKTVDNANPTVGTNVTFTVTVSNNGPSAADAVSVTDQLPAGYTLVSATESVGSYNAGTGVWTVGTLTSGGSATLTVVATVLATGPYLNTATATSTTGDPTPGNNTGTSNPSPVASADISVTKSVSNAAPPVGSNVTFTVIVANAGPSSADSVVVNDALPSGYTLVSATPTIGSYNAGSGVWTVGTLALGADATLTVVATVLETGSYTNTAIGSSTTSDPTPGNNTGTSTPVPVRTPALALVKPAPSNADNDGSGSVTIGDVLTYTITATNTGNVTLTNVVINDTQTVPASQTCATLAPNATCVLTGTHTVTLQDVTATQIVNTATADSAENTPQSASVTTPTARRAIVADGDNGTVANGAAGGQAVANVLGNDTLNGQPATVSTVTITQVSTSNPNVTIDPATGAVNVAPGTAQGSYTLVYQICEIADPTNCSQASVTVTVNAAAIDAVDDVVATPVNGSTGGTNVINVLANDTLGGSAVNPADVTVTPVTSGPLTVKADGGVDVAPGTPAGTYTVTYQLCEVLNPSNCDTATVTITVSAPAITASDDPAGGTGVTPQNTPVTTNVIANDTLNGAPIDPTLVTITVSTDPSNGTVVVNTDGTITYTPRANFSGTDSYVYTICEKLNPTNCATATVTVTVQPNTVTATPDTAQTNQQTPVTINVIGNDTVTGAPLDPGSLTIVNQPGNGTVTCAAGSCTYTPNQFFAGTDTFTYRVCDTSSPTPVCATASVTITVVANAPVLRLVKTSATREVKIGDLVRYTVQIENVGDSPAVNATLVDIPPAGFTFVDNSLTVDDDNKSGVIASANPLRITGIDVGIGGKATVSYFLRVGAGVGKGVHKNQVAGYDGNGTKISNDATAEVVMAGDPLLEDSLIVGSVFDDRDSDGWQDPAKATGVKVQGGFAPGAYVAGSTTVDRGEGPVAEPDASAPLLHGIALGRIEGRSSDAVSAEQRQVVVRQTLSALEFADDFVLTTDEGTTVRMDAAGKTTVERSRGDAAKGLTAQDLQVSRQVSQGASGYVVSYTIRNNGVEERGIPGVRIASVEGLIMETDAYGRYHLEGIEGGNSARGRNFILKVDAATLPPGTVFTTENPRVRRITQGVPTRFDFGVKLPPGEIGSSKSNTDVELGEVFFEAGSAKVKTGYTPMFEDIAGKLRDAGGGSVTVTAQAEEEALAFARARAVQTELLRQLESDPELARKVQVDVVAGVDASQALVSLDPAIRLGEVLFDTDQATIKPQYKPLISEIAKALNQQGSGAVGVIGRADKRGAAAYNVQLGLRRAKAVFEAISAELKPEVRQKVRVDITDDTQAPVGVGNR